MKETTITSHSYIPRQMLSQYIEMTLALNVSHKPNHVYNSCIQQIWQGGYDQSSKWSKFKKKMYMAPLTGKKNDSTRLTTSYVMMLHQIYCAGVLRF